jgi:hypothetical protein
MICNFSFYSLVARLDYGCVHLSYAYAGCIHKLLSNKLLFIKKNKNYIIKQIGLRWYIISIFVLSMFLMPFLTLLL